MRRCVRTVGGLWESKSGNMSTEALTSSILTASLGNAEPVRRSAPVEKPDVSLKSSGGCNCTGGTCTCGKGGLKSDSVEISAAGAAQADAATADARRAPEATRTSESTSDRDRDPQAEERPEEPPRRPSVIDRSILEPVPGRPPSQPEPEEPEQAPAETRSAAGDGELTAEEEAQVRELQQRDAEVRAHEQAHLSAAGGHARGGASYDYQTGPDGRRYAVGGEVQIDTSAVPDDPQATIQKMQQLISAALAPASPSAQDRAVAAQARQAISEAQSQLNSPDESEQESASDRLSAQQVSTDDGAETTAEERAAAAFESAPTTPAFDSPNTPDAQQRVSESAFEDDGAAERPRPFAPASTDGSAAFTSSSRPATSDESTPAQSLSDTRDARLAAYAAQDRSVQDSSISRLLDVSG